MLVVHGMENIYPISKKIKKFSSAQIPVFMGGVWRF